MTRPAHQSGEVREALRAFALSYPGAEEGIACAGTALEKRTVKAGGKAFVFLGMADAMVKLRESLAEATRLAAKEPSRCKVGAHGWVTVTFAGEAAALDLLKRWIDESHRLLVPQKMAARLPARAQGAVARGASAKKRASKKKPGFSAKPGR
jgi:predicted DNA-binding protein (MmcQ/YjbR family)